MLFSNKYLFHVQRQQRKAAGAPVPSTKAKAFEVCTKETDAAQSRGSTTENVGRSGSSISIAGTTFRRNMTETEVKRELFILEFTRGFDEMNIKNKMMLVMEKCQNELKDWFYEQGIGGNLPDTWEEFSNQIVDVCTEKALMQIQKYKDEPWSNYISRLRDKARTTNMHDEEVLKKLRREEAPEVLRTLFYSFGISLDALIQRVEEYEVNIKGYQERKASRRGVSYTRKTDQTKNIFNGDCYTCNKKGHYSYECPEKQNSSSINSLNKDLTSFGLDMDYVKLNMVSVRAVFDSGACESVITSGLLKRLRIKQFVKTRKEFKFIDGSVVVVTRMVDISIEYRDITVVERFNVVENDVDETVLLGNTLTKFLRRKKIPIECTINTGDHPPISWSRPIRNLQDKRDLEALVDDLVERDIVEKSTSSWLNPCVLVRKKNGKLRFCGDFRKLNDLVEIDGFEIPKIQELISLLHGKKYFTCIDLKDGFFQIPIRECDKEKTAFYTGKRLMQFKKMPQGFKNSPAIFQRAMQLILSDLLEDACLVYIDDILVFGNTLEQHDRNLEMVLSRLNEYDLQENKEKRIERVERIRFLGYEISYNCVKPSLERAQGIMSYKSPETRKELQRFIGMINYDRHFIRGLSDLLSPLYRLLSKETKFEWSPKEENIFKQIKNQWKRNLELFVPDMEGDFTLETDASDIGLGACLRQNDKPVAYASRTLSGSEKNYGITEREVLASLWAMEKFEYYLVGKRFKLVTDHKAIEFIRTKLEFGSPRIQRWFYRFQKFDFEVEYRKGTEMITADALSRGLPVKSSLYSLTSKVLDTKEKILEHHELLNHRKKIKEDLKKKGILVSQNMIDSALEQCMVCLKKDRKHIKPGKFIYTFLPGERVAVDILEIKKGDLVILGIDFFSRKVYGKALKSKNSGKILEFIKNIHDKLPIKCLVTDNGKEFNNEMLNNYCRENNIERVFTIPYYHQSNGRIERANRTVREALKHARGPTKKVLANVIASYNKTYHRGIGMSPDEALNPSLRNTVIANQEKYGKEFEKKYSEYSKFEVNDTVIIKKEIKDTKMDNEFEDVGLVVKVLGSDTYEIISGKNKLVRHASQLKRFGGGM